MYVRAPRRYNHPSRIYVDIDARISTPSSNNIYMYINISRGAQYSSFYTRNPNGTLRINLKRYPAATSTELSMYTARHPRLLPPHCHPIIIHPLTSSLVWTYMHIYVYTTVIKMTLDV